MLSHSGVQRSPLSASRRRSLPGSMRDLSRPLHWEQPQEVSRYLTRERPQEMGSFAAVRNGTVGLLARRHEFHAHVPPAPLGRCRADANMDIHAQIEDDRLQAIQAELAELSTHDVAHV